MRARHAGFIFAAFVGVPASAGEVADGEAVARELRRGVVGAEQCRHDPGLISTYALELFLEPTRAKRRDVTERYVREVMAPYDSCEALTAPGAGGCLSGSLGLFMPSADEALIRAALTERVDLYRSCLKRALDSAGKGPTTAVGEINTVRGMWPENYVIFLHPTRRSPLLNAQYLEESRQACSDAQAIAYYMPGCTYAHVRQLTLANDPLADRLLSRVPEEKIHDDARNSVSVLRRWLAFRDGIPDRRNRLAKILDLSGEFVASSDGSRIRSAPSQELRYWALDELLPPDPTTWDPADVAMVLIRAEREDANIKPRPWRAPLPPELQPEERLDLYLRYLKPMGLLRVVALVDLRSVKLPRASPNPHSLDPGSYVRHLNYHQHFADELEHYGKEWDRLHPNVKGPDALRRRDAFAEKRWVATDEAAPHPDLEKVRLALARIRKGEKSQ